MGSVARQVVQLTDSPVFILPINRELASAAAERDKSD
jgi:hypothetical protein